MGEYVREWVCEKEGEGVSSGLILSVWRESGWISMLGGYVCVCERECSGSLTHSRSNTCDMTHSYV